jgi:phosphate transport system substrate-binding protein
MNRRTLALVASALALTVLAAACGGGGGGSSSGSFQGAPLTGAGSTFVQPVYQKWFHDFQAVESNAQINYQAIGSGGGITDLQNKTVDFADSDAPLQPTDLPPFKGAEVVELPVVLGAVAVAYNVPGLKTGLKLDGPTTADIFLGKVTNWNDQEIAKLNPGVTLPNLPIQTVHRSDESGTTFVFTSWLSQESPEWSKKVGADKAVEWPTGSGGNGSAGVTAAIQHTKGAVGYVEYQYAVTTSLGVAAVKGKNSSDFVTPSVDAISAAGGGLTFPISATTNVLNSTAAGAYPLTSTTYFMAYKDLTPLGKDKAQTIVDLLKWMFTTGQGSVKDLNFAPLPSSVAQAAIQHIGDFQYSGKSLTPNT